MTGRKALQRLIYLLVGVLIFEGIARKLMPAGLAGPAILFKDLVALLIAVQVVAAPLPGWLSPLRILWFLMAVAVLPLALMTAMNDPVLAVFGLKQYLLFMPLAWAVPLAFVGRSEPYQHLFTFQRWMVVTIPLTAVVAMIQVLLPSGHWLNLSVAGDDLSAFSAGGRQRVSSTFPFIAQYCWYSLAVAGPVAVAIRFRGQGWKSRVLAWWIIAPLFTIGIFITGSRQSVVGLILVVGCAGMLLLLTGEGRGIGRLVGFTVALVFGLLAAQLFFPDAFVAYDARSGGETFSEEHTREIQGRLNHALFGWRYFAERSEAGMFGRGLGAMSNGVTQFSFYASSIRNRYGWGEVDLANTVAEGGYYLVGVWMAFRLAVVAFCIGILGRLRNGTFRLAAGLCGGFVAFMGITGTLAMQPPLYLWWSLNIGILCALYACERQVLRSKKAGADPCATNGSAEGRLSTESKQVEPANV